jgi:hypothetical protein
MWEIPGGCGTLTHRNCIASPTEECLDLGLHSMEACGSLQLVDSDLNDSELDGKKTSAIAG